MTTSHDNSHEKHKPNPDVVLKILAAGNDRFVAGKAIHPHAGAGRLALAGSCDQKDYAYATVISCSDSRVPVELIFDAGIMDLFVIRVAGNVCNTDEIGSIEYGLAHVRTPVLVVLGHTQCGAVTEVTHTLQGKGHVLERNVAPLLKPIITAVKRAMRGTGIFRARRSFPWRLKKMSGKVSGICSCRVRSPAIWSERDSQGGRRHPRRSHRQGELA